MMKHQGVRCEFRPEGVAKPLEQHGADLLALFTRITLRADVAEDLLQELFLKLRTPAVYPRRQPQSVSIPYRDAPGLRLAPNAAADRTLASGVGGPSEIAAGPPDWRGAVRGSPQRIASLSVLNREVLVLRYLQNHDYPKIAEVLGKTEHHGARDLFQGGGIPARRPSTESEQREAKRGTRP